MSKNKLLKGASLAIAASVFSASAAADVSISGWINQGITYADGPVGSDVVSVSDNGATLGSRITFAGSADVPGGLTAGFDVTTEPRNNSQVLGFGNGGTGTVDSFSNGTGDTFNVLGHSLYVSGAMGKVTLGLQSMPTDNIAVLEDPSLTLWPSISPVFRGNGVITNTTAAVAFGDALTCRTAEILSNGLGIGIDCNGIYRQGVRYDLPTFVDGLGIAIGYANDDVYDVAAKYKTAVGRVSLQGAIGYAENNGVGANLAGVQTHSAADNLQIQFGIMDSVTGLFGTVAYQREESDLEAAGLGMQDETDAYWFKGGIKRQFNSLGDTAIAGQYGLYNDQYSHIAAGLGATGSELQRIGVEVSQYFGSSLIIYGTWENLDAEFDNAAALDGDIDLFTLGVTFFF